MLERTLSTRVPDYALRDLVKAYAEATQHGELTQLLETATDEALLDAFKLELKKAIKGTPTQALVIDTISVFTSATATVAISPAVNSMTELNGSLKNILAGSPSMAGALLMLPIGMSYDRSGGKKEFIALRAIGVLGMLGLTTFASFGNLETVNSFDARFAGVLGLNLLVGSTTPSFLAINNLIHWYPRNKVGFAAGVYGGLGNLAPGLFLLLLQLSLDKLGLPLSFGLSAGTLAVGTGIMAAFYRTSPYHQLRQKGLSHENAIAASALMGQERFPLSPDIKYRDVLKETALDLRAITLSLTSSSYGIFIASTISLYIMLTESLKLSADQAVLATSAGSIWSTIVRLPTGKFVDKCDPSKGVYTFSVANLLIMAGALMTAIPKPLPSLAYTLGAQALIFTGSGIGSTSSLAILSHWSTPENNHSNHYNTGAMTGITASVGVLWGLLLPLTTAGFVYNQGDDGYQNFFYFVAGLSMLATTMTLLTEQHLKTPLQHSFANSWAHTFNRQNGNDNLNDIELGERNTAENTTTRHNHHHHPQSRQHRIQQRSLQPA